MFESWIVEKNSHVLVIFIVFMFIDFAAHSSGTNFLIKQFCAARWRHLLDIHDRVD
jgi:hypothetical protein